MQVIFPIRRRVWVGQTAVAVDHLTHSSCADTLVTFSPLLNRSNLSDIPSSLKERL